MNKDNENFGRGFWRGRDDAEDRRQWNAQQRWYQGAAGGSYYPPAAPSPSEAGSFEGPPKKTDKDFAIEEARRVQRCFDADRRYFTYETMIAHGVDGVACRVRFNSTRNRPAQRFIVKRALNVQEAQTMLKSEKAYLTRLLGAKHIAQLWQPPEVVENPLRSLDGETIIMEWIERGTLEDFLKRRKRRYPHELPNRMLLRMYICLARFCIAMAWPPAGRKGRPAQMELIPGDDAQAMANPTQIIHADMHTANILMGDIEPGDREHAIVPGLKLIDFGRAYVIANKKVQNPGIKSNIFDIALVMQEIITGLPMPSEGRAELVTLRGQKTKTLYTYGAVFNGNRYPNLDEKLAFLLVVSLATDPNERPGIVALTDWLHKIAEERPTEDWYQKNDYPRARYESDQRIAQILGDIILEP